MEDIRQAEEKVEGGTEIATGAEIKVGSRLGAQSDTDMTERGSGIQFEVLEDNKPCSYQRYPEGSLDRQRMYSNGWLEHQFETFEEAINHLNHWLGLIGPLADEYLPDVEYFFYDCPFRIATVVKI